MSAPLVLAIPSKGRLQAASLECFARAGLDIVPAGSARSSRGCIAGLAAVVIA
jgi:ATP phosphoribosyltransferase